MAKTRRVQFSKKRKSKTRRYSTKRHGGASWTDAYMPSSKPAAAPAPATTTTTAPPTDTPTKTKGFSNTSDYKAYVQNTLKANRSAMNMPVTLAAINTKLNALLIANKVNYKFSNGYTARDYNISKTVAESANEGRGELIPNSVRGQITGAQSGIYNKGTEAYASKSPKTPPPTK
jgi:hypothetical protein